MVPLVDTEYLNQHTEILNLNFGGFKIFSRSNEIFHAKGFIDRPSLIRGPFSRVLTHIFIETMPSGTLNFSPSSSLVFARSLDL